jgi:hypothetical protein
MKCKTYNKGGEDTSFKSNINTSIKINKWNYRYVVSCIYMKGKIKKKNEKNEEKTFEACYPPVEE